jgi:hypothetical protein
LRIVTTAEHTKGQTTREAGMQMGRILKWNIHILYVRIWTGFTWLKMESNDT